MSLYLYLYKFVFFYLFDQYNDRQSIPKITIIKFFILMNAMLILEFEN